MPLNEGTDRDSYFKTRYNLLSTNEDAVSKYIEQLIKNKVSHFIFGNELSYSFCPCREKYRLKNKPLLDYLQTHCDGWVEDPQGRYTLNYLIAILLVNLKEKNRLKPILVRNHFQIDDPRLTAILRFSCFSLSDFRNKIKGLFHGKVCKESHRSVLFLCEPNVGLIHPFLKNLEDEKCISNHGYLDYKAKLKERREEKTNISID